MDLNYAMWLSKQTPEFIDSLRDTGKINDQYGLYEWWRDNEMSTA